MAPVVCVRWSRLSHVKPSLARGQALLVLARRPRGAAAVVVVDLRHLWLIEIAVPLCAACGCGPGIGTRERAGRQAQEDAARQAGAWCRRQGAQRHAAKKTFFIEKFQEQSRERGCDWARLQLCSSANEDSILNVIQCTEQAVIASRGHLRHFSSPTQARLEVCAEDPFTPT